MAVLKLASGRALQFSYSRKFGRLHKKRPFRMDLIRLMIEITERELREICRSMKTVQQVFDQIWREFELRESRMNASYRRKRNGDSINNATSKVIKYESMSDIAKDQNLQANDIIPKDSSPTTIHCANKNDPIQSSPPVTMTRSPPQAQKWAEFTNRHKTSVNDKQHHVIDPRGLSRDELIAVLKSFNETNRFLSSEGESSIFAAWFEAILQEKYTWRAARKLISLHDVKKFTGDDTARQSITTCFYTLQKNFRQYLKNV